MATGFPRPQVEWTRHQRSTLLSPFFQEDGCLAVNTAKAHGEEDYICRATNSFGLTETVTTVIATKLIGIITVIAFITFQLYIQNTFLPYVFFTFFFYYKRDKKMFGKSLKMISAVFLILIKKRKLCTNVFKQFDLKVLEILCSVSR